MTPKGLSQLLRGMASVARGASDVEDALRWALNLVCENTGWPLGHVLLTDSATGVLLSTDIWQDSDPERHQPFVAASNGLSFVVGVGMPGRIAATGEPAWVEDVSSFPGFVRAAAAAASGIGPAFSFPILSARGVEGVMEFFAHEAEQPDQALLDLIAHVGIHLGTVVERARTLNASEARAVDAVRSAEQRRDRALSDLADQQGVLERIARGESLRTTLDILCRQIEKQFIGAHCSVLLVDDKEKVLRHAAAPTLPDGFREAIDGLPIQWGMGACGSAAASGEVVIVNDTLRDALTEPFLGLAETFDLGAVWSYPLRTAAADIVGTFAVYRRNRHTPTGEEIAAVTAAGHLAALAIERSRSEAALEAAARIDSLTSLPNRARFLQVLQQRLADPRTPLAVMFLDLDRFKWINDSLGHPAGDRVLAQVAGRFRESLASRHMVARFGGDEFTVLIEDATEPRIAWAAEQAKAVFAKPFWLDGGEFYLAVSVGIARNEEGSDAFSLVRDADAAMFAAKETGGARHVLFDQRLRERAIERLALESGIRRGIERDEFVLHFQPIVELATGRWHTAEALVRWNHPVAGLTPPAQFIPLAEETGLIVPLGEKILTDVVARAAAWQGEFPNLRVAANISAVQLTDPTLGQTVGALLRRHGLPPSRLVLEVTETAVMEQLEAARATLEDIAALGVSLVIDDFGTGYSSIARLNDLPVGGIKIDRSFTTRLGVDSSVEAVLAAIIDLGHALRLQVVAEGIETQHALERLRDLGCDLGQGFHLAMPVPPADLLDTLRKPPP